MQQNQSVAQPNQTVSQEDQYVPPTGQTSQWDELLPTNMKPVPEEVIFEWTAASRPFRKRKPRFYSNIAIIVLLLSLILFFAGQYLPIALVVAVTFLVYVLYTIPPSDSTHKITTYGIRSDDQIFYWEELGRFWFETKPESEILLIEVGRFPWRLILLFNPADKATLTDIISRVLLEQRPPDTTIDKWAKWMQERIPLE